MPRTNPASVRIAQFYAAQRGVPAVNLIGLPVPDKAVIGRDEFRLLRSALLDRLPSGVQSLLLIWSKPYAVECMSITTAFAAGYRAGFCEPGCGRTLSNPLFDTQGWLPADTTGWLPAMLLPSDDEALARATDRAGTKGGWLAPARHRLSGANPGYRAERARGRLHRCARRSSAEPSASSSSATTPILGPITGCHGLLHRCRAGGRAASDQVSEFRAPPRITSPRPAAFWRARRKCPALEWLRQGATASYGSVSEPCNHVEKFPSPAVFLDHYLRGDTMHRSLLEERGHAGPGIVHRRAVGTALLRITLKPASLTGISPSSAA